MNKIETYGVDIVTPYGSGINNDALYYKEFGVMPNKIFLRPLIEATHFMLLRDLELLFYSKHEDDTYYEHCYFIDRDKHFIVYLYRSGLSYGASVIFEQKESVNDILEKLVLLKEEEELGNEHKIYLLVDCHNELDTFGYDIKLEDVDIALNYGEDFVPKCDYILKELNRVDEKGIILFHGIPGTGKTSLIKHLCKNVDKKFIFLPPDFVEALSSPKFVPFLLDNPNCVLVIEDGERILRDRDKSGATATLGVSNLLNVSDGILGDCLKIQVIVTFNAGKDSIDKAFLRKGRLIAEHEFTALSVEDANKLLTSLGKETTVTRSTTLADIYNIDKKQLMSQKETEKIGFFK